MDGSKSVEKVAMDVTTKGWNLRSAGCTVRVCITATGLTRRRKARYESSSIAHPFFENNHVFKLIFLSIFKDSHMLAEESIPHFLKFRSL